jgi:hypothetical protein
LTLERGRDIALRNLLRKVFILGGFEPLKEGQTTPVRRTRVPLREFSVAIGLGQSSKITRLELMEDDEVECLLAGMIYKVRISVAVTVAASEGLEFLGISQVFPHSGSVAPDLANSRYLEPDERLHLT